jgi:hypothetical protein
MAAQPNVAGMARLLYVVAGLGLIGWGLWSVPGGWQRLAWVIVGGAIEVCGLIGYSPVHAIFAREKESKAS